VKTCPLCDTAYPNHHSNCDRDGALLIESRELEPGTVIRGKYRIVRLLGRGGMGTVYLAEHILLGRKRALKFISSELSQDPKFLKRFRHEAQAAIELQHPNVVEVVDLDQAEDGSPYIAMEYVEGPDLRHILANGALPVERALAISRGVALGLGAAHAKGIVHRDVKPENILLTGGNGTPETPKLLDFGIAAMKESGTAVSRTRGLMLTPDYAAPEQWKGMAAEEQDGRVDFYALGGVLHEMLTGKTSFHSHNTEGWMYQHLQTEPEAPSRLRSELVNWTGLDVLVLRLLAKDREQRPKDAQELVGLIDAVQNIAPMVRRETVREEAGQDWNQGSGQRSRRVPVWVWVASVAVLLAGLFVVWFSSKRSMHPPESASQTNSVQNTSPVGVEQQAVIDNPRSKLGDAGAIATATYPKNIRTATFYAKECDAGIAIACIDLGNLYGYGQGVAKDKTHETALYSKACDAGEGEGCFHLGMMYEGGRDNSREVALYTKACDAGEGKACSSLATMYRQGEGVVKDKEKAQMLSKKACSMVGGDDGTCEAVHIQAPTNAGPEQQAVIADSYGKNADSTSDTASNAKACDESEMFACGQLGLAYEMGRGVSKNSSHAAALLAKACNAGELGSCYTLGRMYVNEDGFDGLAMDYSRAAALFAKPCNDENEQLACYYLGFMSENGYGVAKDYARAAALYPDACRGGMPVACSRLGNLYWNGWGVPKDINKAKEFLKRGCSSGDNWGCNKLKELK